LIAGRRAKKELKIAPLTKKRVVTAARSLRIGPFLPA